MTLNLKSPLGMLISFLAGTGLGVWAVVIFSALA